MTTILLLLALVLAFAGLVRWTRHDAYAAHRRPESFC